MKQLFVTEKYGIKFEFVVSDHREYLIYQMYDTDFMRSKIEEYIDFIASNVIKAGRANEDGTIDEEVFYYKCRDHYIDNDINNVFHFIGYAHNFHINMLTFLVYKIENDHHVFSVARKMAGSDNLDDIKRAKENIIEHPDQVYYPLGSSAIRNKEPITTCYLDCVQLFALFDQMYRVFVWDYIQKVIEDHSLCGVAFVKMVNNTNRCSWDIFIHIYNGMIVHHYENGYTFEDIDDGIYSSIYKSYYYQKHFFKNRGI